MPAAAVEVPVVTHIELRQQLSIDSVKHGTSGNIATMTRHTSPESTDAIAAVPGEVNVATTYRRGLGHVPSYVVLLARVPRVDELPDAAPDASTAGPDATTSGDARPCD